MHSDSDIIKTYKSEKESMIRKGTMMSYVSCHVGKVN